MPRLRPGTGQARDVRSGHDGSDVAAGSPAGSIGMTRPAPEEREASVEHDDTTSDPSQNDTEGNEWANEGGAVQEGPATDPDHPD